MILAGVLSVDVGDKTALGGVLHLVRTRVKQASQRRVARVRVRHQAHERKVGPSRSRVVPAFVSREQAKGIFRPWTAQAEGDAQ